MASIKYSGLLDGIWGKLNGSVFSGNRSGAVIKNKTTPTNPATGLQVQRRSNFAANACLWRTLTDGQRTDWNNLALTVWFVNHWGTSYNPSGYNLFMLCNANLLLIGRAMMRDAAINKVVTPLTGVTVLPISTQAGNIIISFTGQSTAFNHIHVISASQPLSQGVSYNKARFKVIALIPENIPNDFDCWINYVAMYGAPKAGTKIFLKMKVVNWLNGFANDDLSSQNFVNGNDIYLIPAGTKNFEWLPYSDPWSTVLQYYSIVNGGIFRMLGNDNIVAVLSNDVVHDWARIECSGNPNLTFFQPKFNAPLLYCDLSGNALSLSVVDYVLLSADAGNQLNGTLLLAGGTNATPTDGGFNTNLTNLNMKGWVITYNP